MFTILDYSSALEYSIIRRYTNIVYYYYYFVNICMYLLLCRNKLFFLFLYKVLPRFCLCLLEIISLFRSLRAGSQVFTLFVLFLCVILHTMCSDKRLPSE